MRCARIDAMIDRYVDGVLPPGLAAVVSAHAESCPRCAGRIADARRLLGAFAAEPQVLAPPGFTGRVMDAVYRAALSGAPDESATVNAARPGSWTLARLRTYRRLGLSFMLAAAVLTAGLVLPQSFYPEVIRTDRVAAGLARDGQSAVRDALHGAGRTVQVALGKGGMTR